ncbi:uncharacterized protein LOC144097112 isoform X1 [Amblyomma americanum]
MQRLSEFSLLFLLSLGGLLSNGDGNLREETNSLMELDIRKAFDTSDLVWLYQQNYNNTYNDSGPQGIEYHTYTCLRNNRTSLTEKQYNFTQTVKIDNREEVYQYSGNFVFNATKAENPPDSLLIYEYPGKRHFELMTLVYNDGSSYDCMVFFVYSLYSKLTDAGQLCEMYIRGNAVNNPPPQDCVTFYNNKCRTHRQETYKIYIENCTRGAEYETEPINVIPIKK